MKSIIVLIILAMVSGCSVSTKVLEVAREDQALQGNRGYLLGEAPKRERKPSIKKRRILEVDMTRIFDSE